MRDYRDVQRGNQANNTTSNAALRAGGVFKSPGKTYPCLALTEDDLALTAQAVGMSYI